MKRFIAMIAIAALCLVFPAAPKANAALAGLQDDGCRVVLLWVNNYSDGSYTVTHGWQCTGFSMLCQTRYDRNGNQIGETCQEV